jgi:hypothetical protein
MTSRIKLICKQCGEVCAEEDEGPRLLPPEVHFFCSIKCIKAYNVLHDIPNDGLEGEPKC